MKAILLAAGYGTRLRPLTNTTAKCMVPIQGKPLLQWWMELFERNGVTEVLINTHYLAEQVREFIGLYNKRKTGMKLTEFFEPELLGSGGTVKANQSFVEGEDAFFICYADNLTSINLSTLYSVHRKTNGSLLTMALFRAEHPQACGIAALDSQNRIIDFTEKPAVPKSNLANAGVYIAGESLFSYFPEAAFSDFGKDVLPKLINKMYGWETTDYLIDIGSPENYMRAQKEWLI